MDNYKSKDFMSRVVQRQEELIKMYQLMEGKYITCQLILLVPIVEIVDQVLGWILQTI